MQERYFLLGGADLEMLTIKSVLDKERIPYSDMNLGWGDASLSSYKEILYSLPMSTHIYGVELYEDIVPPENYHRIDHHNDKTMCKSSLEQVMELLGISMDRHQTLVALNDRGYISAMKHFGATDHEVAYIRLLDRKAQGVTAIDEQLAEKAINENMEIIGSVIKLRAYSPKFSPICDRLYPYQTLLIYTDSEWMLYGQGANKVKAMFEQEYSKDKLFCGGGSSCGYIGAKQSVYTADTIKNMVDKIIGRIAR